MMKIDNDLPNPIASQVFGDVANERFTKDGYCGLGPVLGEWPESSAVTGGKYHCTHQAYFIEALHKKSVLSGLVANFAENNNRSQAVSLQEALEASRMTRSKVPGATLRKREFRLSETATLMVGF